MYVCLGALFFLFSLFIAVYFSSLLLYLFAFFLLCFLYITMSQNEIQSVKLDAIISIQ